MGSQNSNVKARSFVRLCFSEACKTSPEKADWIVLMIGAALGPVALMFPRWEITLTHVLLIAPISALASVFIFRLFLSPLLVYRNRDTEARAAESELRAVITKHEETIKQRDETLQALNAKPKRSAAEQHDYELVKSALGVVKEKGKIALRFLRNNGTLKFGISMGSPSGGPLPPAGISLAEMLWAYRHCADAGVVSMSRNLGATEETFTIVPHMIKAVEQALFED
jgi:hypothetical protein